MRWITLIAVFCCTTSHAASVADWPVGTAVETYHGITVPDPYRGLEDLKDPKVLSWYRAQQQHARQTLDALPGKAALQARIGELLRAKPVVTGYLQKDATGGIWYFRRAGEEQFFSLYRRASESAPEQAIVQPAQFNRDSKQAQIMAYSPAHDGSKVVVTLAWDGDELHEEQRVILRDGTVLPDVLEQVQGSDAIAEDHSQWLPDGTGFFYAKLKGAPQGKPDDYEDGELRLHRLGTPQSADLLLMNRPSQPALNLKPQEYPVPSIIAGSPYVFAWVQDGVGDARLFATTLDAALIDKPEWIALGEAADYTAQGARVTMLRKLKSPNGSLWQATLPAPDSTPIVPEGKAVLTALRTAQNGLYVTALDAGRNTLSLLQAKRVPRQCIRAPCPQVDYRMAPLALPLASNSAFVTHPQQPGVLLRLRDWHRASQNFVVDAQGQVKPLPWPAPGPYDAPANLLVERIEVTSADGAKIPVAIVHDKTLKRDGKAALLVEGYSAYGLPTNAYLSPAMLAFYERGGVYASVSARGSGDKGRAWHLAGKGALKANTWRDVIAATEWLHAQGYSSPARSTVTGTSAGGILMGGAITERPDLFGGAIGHVPSGDMLGIARSSNGPPNFPEFGDPAKFDEFAALLQMSPYHRVQQGVAYPAVLLTTGLNDKRVESWVVAKLYAKLAASSTSGAPVLMTVDETSGHFGDSLAAQTANQTDIIAFALSRGADTCHCHFDSKAALQTSGSAIVSDAIAKASAFHAFAAPPPAAQVNTTPYLIYVDLEPKPAMVNLPWWDELPDDIKGAFRNWAAGDAVAARRLFDLLFQRFLIAHETAHWLRFQIKGGETESRFYDNEAEANRFAAAYWQSTPGGPAFLAELEQALTQMVAALPDPTPKGEDPVRYFGAHYQELSGNPNQYGYYQARFMLDAVRARETLRIEALIADMARKTP